MMPNSTFPRQSAVPTATKKRDCPPKKKSRADFLAAFAKKQIHGAAGVPPMKMKRVVIPLTDCKDIKLSELRRQQQLASSACRPLPMSQKHQRKVCTSSSTLASSTSLNIVAAPATKKNTENHKQQQQQQCRAQKSVQMVKMEEQPKHWKTISNKLAPTEQLSEFDLQLEYEHEQRRRQQQLIIGVQDRRSSSNAVAATVVPLPSRHHVAPHSNRHVRFRPPARSLPRRQHRLHHHHRHRVVVPSRKMPIPKRRKTRRILAGRRNCDCANEEEHWQTFWPIRQMCPHTLEEEDTITDTHTLLLYVGNEMESIF